MVQRREGKFSPSVHVKAVNFIIQAEEEVTQQAIQRDARQQGRKKQGPLLTAGPCGPQPAGGSGIADKTLKKEHQHSLRGRR